MKFEKFKPTNHKKADFKFTLRISAELHEEIAKYAQENDMSMNTLVLNCIEYALSNIED